MASRMATPTGSLGNMTAFSADGRVDLGGGLLARVDDEAHVYLSRLAERFPDEFNRALKSVGYELMREVKRSIWANGPSGTQWPRLSRMRVYRRMETLEKAGAGNGRAADRIRLKKVTKQKQKAIAAGEARDNMLNRWKRPPSGLGRDTAFSGRLASAVRYKHYSDSMRVRVGFINRVSSSYAAAVQGARRGTPGQYQFQGRQYITQKMRRAYWAAGVPLSRDKQFLEQPERPLIEPVFAAFRPKIKAIVESRITQILSQRNKAALMSSGRRMLLQ
jgi:hypothetical protein